MSVRISWRMTTATIGPKTPPRPPARLTPPSTTAATLRSVYGPGTGVPMPVLAVSDQAGEGGEQTGQRVGDDLRPADRHAAPEGRELIAADRVQRQAEPRARIGIQTTATTTTSTTAALGTTRAERARGRGP